MAEGIDFTSCRLIPGRAYNGANGKKIAVEYNGTLYMLKFPPSGRNKPTELSYTNSCFKIACTDSCECFDDNKSYLQERMDEEQNPKVRRILKKDMEMLDHVQAEMSTARQFLFILRCKGMKPEQIFQTANRTEKVISEQGFEVRRMKKADIKRFLAIYFGASMNGDQMPDVDGEQFYEVEDDEEEN